jgi:aspartate/methionine/tyrosine aminotransferase
MTRVSQRAGAIAESATLAVDARAKELRASGEDVIGFGAGEPDYPTPEHIVVAAVEAARDPRNHRYTPTAGLPELRLAIAEKTHRESGVDVEPSQVLVTNGAKHALYEALQAIVDPGEEVLLPAPYWTTYPEAIGLAGGEAVVVPTTEAAEFRVSVDKLEAARTPRTKALFFVSPGNPSGTVYPPAEVKAIGRWAYENGVWVVADEIYEHLTYGKHRFTSMPGLLPELADTTLILNGVAKTYAMTGWRVGWIVGPPDVMKAAINLQSHSTSNVGNVSQRAALAALNGGLDAVTDMRTAYERRGARMHELLEAIPGVTCMAPQGAFYCFPSFEAVLGRDIRGRTPRNTIELAGVMLDEAKVAVVPGEAFGSPGYARLTFAVSDADIEEGIERIAKLLA